GAGAELRFGKEQADEGALNCDGGNVAIDALGGNLSQRRDAGVAADSEVAIDHHRADGACRGDFKVGGIVADVGTLDRAGDEGGVVNVMLNFDDAGGLRETE